MTGFRATPETAPHCPSRACARRGLLGFAVGAPAAFLIKLVEADRLPQGFGVKCALDQRQPGDERPADRHQRRQRRHPPRIDRKRRRAQRRDRRGRLVDRQYALRQDKFDVEALLRPSEQRVPRRYLFGLQHGIAVVAVTEQVGRGVGGNGFDKGSGVGRREVDRGIGKAGHRHRRGIDRLALFAPFGGDRLGERGACDGQRRALRRSHRSSVEPYAPAAILRREIDLFPETLHRAITDFWASATAARAAAA
jgi:hypothetical protein